MVSGVRRVRIEAIARQCKYVFCGSNMLSTCVFIYLRNSFMLILPVGSCTMGGGIYRDMLEELSQVARVEVSGIFS